MIEPHGGALVDRFQKRVESIELNGSTRRAPKITVSDRTVCDLICIANGAFSPLEGFLKRDDYESCVESMRLTNGVLWPIPIVLPVNDTELAALRLDAEAALADANGDLLASIEVADIYTAHHEKETLKVYGTSDANHPGVAAVLRAPRTYVGGNISLIKAPAPEFPQYSLTPRDSRARFAELGWNSVVGFQTRNPVHRAHEYLQKVALEIVDGLFLHPLVGTTKDDDLPAAVRMRCYEALLQDYYPKERALLGVYQAAMRYAGPREAVLHAIARKNYGCSHFIVGRDHAGAGSYYGPFDAQHIFDEIEAELGVNILRFDNAFWCKSCEGMATAKTCPHSSDAHVTLSGTKVRELLRSGERPPAEFSRPEIADILIRSLAESQTVRS